MRYKENIIKWNLEKYNSNNELYNKYQVQMFLENANNHLISTFKDYLFYDDLTEFLSKFYKKRESSELLGQLYAYYEKSSYIFPNYTVLTEGKYVYKNIIKKQLLIDYLEDIENKKKNNDLNRNKKEFIKPSNNEKIFDTQLYNNIIISNGNNNSNLNLLFGINMKPHIRLNTKNNSKNNSKKFIENNSIISIKKLIKVINESYTRSIGTNTADDYIKKKSINNMKKRKNISPKEISNSTNYNSNISNINVNSMFRIDKNLQVSNNNISNNNQNNNRHISNINSYMQKNLKTYNKLCKINAQKKINSYLINFNSSFMKSFINKIKEKKKTSDKNVFHFIKSKNKNISMKSNIKISKKKHFLTPIENIKKHISKCSSILKDTQIKSYLNHLPSVEHCSKINLKYKKIKVINNNIKNKNKLSTSLQAKSKFDIKLFENKYKKIAINNNNNKNNYHRYQRNKKIITDFNINNPKKNNESVSLNNSIYKTINISNIKKTNIPLTKYRKDRKISLCNDFIKNDMNNLTKKNYCIKNISKRIITPISFNDDEKKKNCVKIITSYFNSKLPSPRKPRGNILKYHFNSLHKNKTLVKACKTLHNSKYFTKKRTHVIIFNHNKK